MNCDLKNTNDNLNEMSQNKTKIGLKKQGNLMATRWFLSMKRNMYQNSIIADQIW